MQKIIELETSRLLLRQWRGEDFALFAEMNADPVVMEFFPATLSREQSDKQAAKIQSLIAVRGWGFWALELKNSNTFIGFTGLHMPEYDLPFAPCVETGWRLARAYWGHGYATEAASKALDFAFESLQLDKVYAFTALTNHRSQAVMQRLKMTDTKNNFQHPKVAQDSVLREHVLYEMNASQWLKNV